MSHNIPTPAKRMVMSITSYFCIPEQGMRDFEYLCKASAFLVKSNPNIKNKNFTSKYHVLTVSHVLAPWKWPKLYPDEWLKFVNEKHTHYTVELRHDDGVFITQLDLFPKVFHHPTRDLAILHFGNEIHALDVLKKLDLEHNNELLSSSDPQFPLKDGEQLQFHGHHVVQAMDKSFACSSNEKMDKTPYNHLQDDPKVIPTIFNGTVLGRSKNQIFSKTTPMSLPEGMCGGPVLISRSNYDSNSSINKENNNNNKIETQTIIKKKRQGVPLKELNTPPQKSISPVVICGLVEGTVPQNYPVEELRGTAVFVEAPDIYNFICDVEEDRVTPVLGGEATLFVAQDDNPDKSDLKRII